MDDDPVDDPKAELALVERDLAEARKEVDDLRQELGERTDGPGDAVDATTLIEQLNVAESLLEDLQLRRTTLRQRVGSSEAAGGDAASQA